MEMMDDCCFDVSVANFFEGVPEEDELPIDFEIPGPIPDLVDLYTMQMETDYYNPNNIRTKTVQDSDDDIMPPPVQNIRVSEEGQKLCDNNSDKSRVSGQKRKIYGNNSNRDKPSVPVDKRKTYDNKTGSVSEEKQKSNIGKPRVFLEKQKTYNNRDKPRVSVQKRKNYNKNGGKPKVFLEEQKTYNRTKPRVSVREQKAYNSNKPGVPVEEKKTYSNNEPGVPVEEKKTYSNKKTGAPVQKQKACSNKPEVPTNKQKISNKLRGSQKSPLGLVKKITKEKLNKVFEDTHKSFSQKSRSTTARSCQKIVGKTKPYQLMRCN